MEVYNRNRENLVEETIEANILSAAMVKWFNGWPADHWMGSATELLKTLNSFTDDQYEHQTEWTKDATRLSGKIKNVASFLRRVGIDVEFGHDSRGNRQIIIERLAN